jgi:transcriptional regulator with XRE-family HTH domain
MRHQPISHIRDVPEQKCLGHAVRVQRAIRGLSQEELGFRSGLHRNYIGAIERGEINPTFGTLRRLARGLRLSMPDLMTAYVRAEVESQEARGEPECDPCHDCGTCPAELCAALGENCPRRPGPTAP